MPEVWGCSEIKRQSTNENSAEQKLSIEWKCVSSRFCKKELLWSKSDLKVTFGID